MISTFTKSQQLNTIWRILSNKCFLNCSVTEKAIRCLCTIYTSTMAEEYTKECCKDQSQKFTVAIEGNIGSGKTTLLQYFTRCPNTLVFQEPVESWRNVEGFNLLNLMYSDSNKWSLTFQSYVQLTMAQLHMKKHKLTDKVKLMERSIYSAKYCFVENLFQSGKLTKPDYVVLTKWFDFIVGSNNTHLDLIVYLQTTPETVFHRIRKRCRQEERVIPLEYLKNLHDLHEDWLITQRNFVLPCPVLVLDANCDLDELENLCQTHVDKILFTNCTLSQSAVGSVSH